jgi:hypothetical protein
MKPNWLTTLDAFDCHLDAQTELVEAGRYDEIVAFDPSPDLPPLPWDLVARVSGLLDRAQALTERAGGLRDEAGKRMARSRRLAFAQRHIAVYVDQQA